MTVDINVVDGSDGRIEGARVDIIWGLVGGYGAKGVTDSDGHATVALDTGLTSVEATIRITIGGKLASDAKNRIRAGDSHTFKIRGK